MRILLFLLLIVSGQVFSAPFLVSDPDTSKAADACVYQEGTAAAISTPLVVGGCKIDLAGFSAGTHNLQVWFRSSLLGVDSSKVPFRLRKARCWRYWPLYSPNRAVTVC